MADITQETLDIIANNEQFQDFMKLLFQLEGGYSNKKSDMGGKTKYGITQIFLSSFLKQFPLFPIKDVIDLTTDLSKQIYYLSFYKPSEKFFIKNDDEYNYNCFDININSGYGRLVSLSSEAKGDLENMYEVREKFYKSIADNKPSQKANLNGWLNRLQRIKNYFAQG